MAQELAYSRVGDVRFNGSPTPIEHPLLHRPDSPVLGVLGLPAAASETWVVPVSPEGLVSQQAHSDSLTIDGSYLGRWLDRLDSLDSDHDWLAGSRQARAYHDEQAAIDDGFTAEAGIEQPARRSSGQGLTRTYPLRDSLGSRRRRPYVDLGDIELNHIPGPAV